MTRPQLLRVVLLVSGLIAVCLLAESLSAVPWLSVYSPRSSESPCKDASTALRVEIPSARFVVDNLANDVSSIFEFDQWSRVDGVRVEYTHHEPILRLEHFSSRSELPVVETFEWLLSQSRYNATDASTLVLDIGANSGFFSSMAGLLGYRVFAFEPQPSCLPWIAIHAHRNRVSDRVCILNAGLDNRPEPGFISIDSFGGCNPGYSALDHVHHRDRDDAFASNHLVRVLNLTPLCSMLIHRDMTVPMVKIDTEGAETGILESLDSALRAHRIRNLLVKLAPGVWVSRDHEHGLARGYTILHRFIADYGYLFKALDDGEPRASKVVGQSPFGNSTLSHLKWYDVPDLLAYLTELARSGHGDNVLLTLDFITNA